MKFAKLYERGEDQVLVTACQTDEGLPCLKFVMYIGEAEVSPEFKYKDGSWESRDKAFDLVDEGAAFSLRDSFVKQYGDSL